MNGEHRVEPLGFLVDRDKPSVPEKVGAVGSQHPADQAELPHTSAQFLCCGLGVLNRQQRHGPEARAHADELLVEEGVVRPAERHGPVPILQEGEEEAEGRIEDGRLDAPVVQRAEPGRRVAGPVAEAAEEAAVPAVPRVHGEREGAVPVRLV